MTLQVVYRLAARVELKRQRFGTKVGVADSAKNLLSRSSKRSQPRRRRRSDIRLFLATCAAL
jgi:hypothetical protein